MTRECPVFPLEVLAPELVELLAVVLVVPAQLSPVCQAQPEVLEPPELA